MNGYRISVAALLAAGLGLSMVPAAVAAAPSTPWKVSFQGGAGAFVNDLAAVGSKNAWSAGEQSTNVLDPKTGSYWKAPLMRRWNGAKWTVMASPAGPKGHPLRQLHLVDASSPGNVWTYGSAAASGELTPRSVLSRWNGKRWQLMGSGLTQVTDLEVQGAKDTWVVGYDYKTRKQFFKHYHNGKWTSLPAPSGLREVSVRSAKDIWGIGYSGIWRWNGKSWRAAQLPKITVPAAPLPSYGKVTLRYDAVLTTGTKDVWVAVGFQQGDWSQPGTALLRLLNNKWQQTRLPKDRISALSKDGKGGLWAGTRQETITATPEGQDPYSYHTLSIDSLHIVGGKPNRQKIPVSTFFELTALVAIPGTGSAFASGFDWGFPQGNRILKYGG